MNKKPIIAFTAVLMTGVGIVLISVYDKTLALGVALFVWGTILTRELNEEM